MFDHKKETMKLKRKNEMKPNWKKCSLGNEIVVQSTINLHVCAFKDEKVIAAGICSLRLMR